MLAGSKGTVMFVGRIQDKEEGYNPLETPAVVQLERVQLERSLHNSVPNMQIKTKKYIKDY